MKPLRLALIAPAFIIAMAFVAACGDSATPTPPAPPTPTSTNTPIPTDTPTPTNTPTPTFTPTPTATPTPEPTATFTPTPTATPTPEPTATFTPTPTATPTPAPTATPTNTPTPRPTPTPTLTPTPEATATPTPTPTPEPTPTPMRDLATGASLAAPGVVGLSSGESQWTGVVVDINGTTYIVTTTSNLGSSPSVQYTTAANVRGNAWVAGRNDDSNVAVFQAIDPTQPLDVVDTTGDISVPSIGKELATIEYLRGISRTANTSVAGSLQDPDTQLTYFQLQGFHQVGSEGGAVVDEYGRLRGMRIEAEHASEALLAQPGSRYALAAPDLIRVALLVQGNPIKTNYQQCSNQGTTGSPPPIPGTYRGKATIGGQVPPAGSTLYAKVTRRGLPDLWFPTPIDPTTGGGYQVTLGVCQAAYVNRPVEFWLDGVQATAMGTVRIGQTVTLDIDFPAA